MPSTIIIIYNAKSSVGGKLKYAYHKLTTPSSPCAACDFTHGGLSLSETVKWKETKKQIFGNVRQLHIDELDQEIIDFSKANLLRYPVVLGSNSQNDGQLKLLMTTEDLTSCAGDHSRFLEVLRAKCDEENISIGPQSVKAGSSL